MTWKLPFRREKHNPVDTQELARSSRDALELRQISEAANAPSREQLIAEHLTEAARLRAEGAKVNEQHDQIESRQIIRSDADELFSKATKMIQVFQRFGVPGIEVEVLQKITPSDEGSNITPISLAQYTGINPYEFYSGNHRPDSHSENNPWGVRTYVVAQRLTGWLISPPIKPPKDNGNRARADREYDTPGYLRIYDGHSRHFGTTRPWLLTADGGNYSAIITPAGVKDGRVKGVEATEANAFQKEYLSDSHNSFLLSNTVKAFESFFSIMVSTAMEHGYDPAVDQLQEGFPSYQTPNAVTFVQPT